MKAEEEMEGGPLLEIVNRPGVCTPLNLTIWIGQSQEAVILPCPGQWSYETCPYSNLGLVETRLLPRGI